MPNFPNFSPDWGFNSVPNPPWNPNAPPSASFFVNPAPSHETMLLYGYLPGPPYLGKIISIELSPSLSITSLVYHDHDFYFLQMDFLILLIHFLQLFHRLWLGINKDS